jgi:hypothetical protein
MEKKKKEFLDSCNKKKETLFEVNVEICLLAESFRATTHED